MKAAEQAGGSVPWWPIRNCAAFSAGQGLSNFQMMNTGGTIDLDGFTVTMVRADHSSGGDGSPAPIWATPPG